MGRTATGRPLCTWPSSPTGLMCVPSLRLTDTLTSLTPSSLCFGQYLHADPSHRDVDAGLLARTFMNAAKQRLILYEIESPGLATIRGIMLLAALSKWVVAERLAQTQKADLTAFARPVNANGDDRQGWLLLGMATRLSEDCTFASSLSLCSEADLDLLQSTAGLVRLSHHTPSRPPDLTHCCPFQQHLDPAHLVESGAMSRTAAIARKRMFWTFFVSRSSLVVDRAN